MSFPIDMAYSVLSACFPGALRQGEPLSLHCALGVGGPADLWLPLRTRAELIHLVHLCAEHHFQLLLVGNGTNTIYPDEGVHGIVGHIMLNSHALVQNSRDTALLDVDAGARWRHLVEETASEGWGGIDFGLEIPGSLGGALVTNTGAHNSDLEAVVAWVDVLDARGANNEGEDSFSPPLIVRYAHDEIDFSYRTCRMRSHRLVSFDQQGHAVTIPRAMIEPPEIVIALGLRVKRVDIDALRETIQHFRQSHMPRLAEQFQTDSIFIDTPDYHACELIERAGLHEARYGQAQVAPGKANAIRNLGGATALDVIHLIELLHKEVLARTGVDLLLDVELLAFT